MKKENTKELGKNFFPAEIVLRGERYFPEEFFNPSIKRDIFNDEVIDLEDLWVEGTHAEGQWFYGALSCEGKLVKFNEHKEWEEVISFEPDYEDGGVETIVARRRNDLDNPVVYFLLED